MSLASSAGISRTKTLRQRISPPCVWSWIGPLRRSGSLRFQKFSMPGVIDDELVVEVDGRRVRRPGGCGSVFHSPNGLSAWTSGSRPGAPLAVVEQPAGALVGPAVPLAALLGRSPRSAPAASPAGRCRCRPSATVLYSMQQLDVAVLAVGGQVGALAVVDQLAVLDASSASSRRRSTSAICFLRSSSARACRACRGRSAACRASRRGPCR